MASELNLQPEFSGVVYSPGWSGWQLLPDDLLASGLMVTKNGETYIRSVLLFSYPELPPDAIILQAFVRVRIRRNEPPEMVKQIGASEAPRNPQRTWTVDEERQMALLSEHQLSNEIGLDLDFDVTALAERWAKGSPNNGLVLRPGSFDHWLLAFPRVEAAGPVPFLRTVYVRPSPEGQTGTLSVGPDAAMVSWALPYGRIAVRNLGPGLAWISPLYALDEERSPLDPAGIPEGVIEPGGHLIIRPRLRASRMFIRIETALSEATVMIIPLASG